MSQIEVKTIIMSNCVTERSQIEVKTVVMLNGVTDRSQDYYNVELCHR